MRLTEFSHGAGCACKIGADALGPILSALPRPTDPNLLVGSAGRDDAAVYRVADDLAIVSTADFFTPIVDDPFDFGRIAATNALSDVYAMGGRPVLCLNLVAFSLADLGEDVLKSILMGGAEVAAEAGAAIGGGHSIDDPEPKYGMAVTGLVDPAEMQTNAGGRPGDALYLSKPVGGGLITTAAKKGLAPQAVIDAAIEVMTTLNDVAAGAARHAHASAMTDVTGFGLLGHLGELCAASGVAAEVVADQVPAIDGALDLAGDERCIAGGTRRNAEHVARFTEWADEVDEERRVLLADAMTSGGLLVAAPSVSTGEGAVPDGVEIGRLVDGPPGSISVV